VEQLAESLHTIHALPINDCPIDKTPTGLIAWGRQRIRAGITPRMVEEEDLTGSPDEALDGLEGGIPSLEGPVITHGDYCLPNVMIPNDKVSGFIDLGYFGLGDPYRDFIAAQSSVRRNLGEAWVQPFFDAFGRESLDEPKLRWYRQIQAFD
jgi:aminoglycoside phosphotransferase